ncbi:MAG: tyrosine-type recombinase/integrase [Patescibacteria group bacterium]|nr:tyrosine-type recombinase/integrase [Patescibacteria group bacterium]
MKTIELPLIEDFLLDLKVNGYSPETIYNYERDLTVFKNFLEEEDLEFKKISKRDILNYKAYLISIDRKTPADQKTEKNLSAYSTNRMLSSLRSLFKYLIEMDYPVPLPPDAIKMSKTIKKKPQIPELSELITLIESPMKLETDKRIALRNRAIMEVLFATGMRISELVNLRQDKIDAQGRIFILGKGKKERFVYLTPRARKHLDEYLKIKGKQSPFVFIPFKGMNANNIKGAKISANYIQERIKRYRELLGINLPVSAHTLRHGFATYLAECGANPAAIQVLLGHESLDTTTRYVHASDRYAESVQKKFHPLKN